MASDIVLNFDYEGSNGSNNILDTSENSFPTTVNGTVQISTNYSPVGVSSGLFANPNPHAINDYLLIAEADDPTGLLQDFLDSTEDVTFETYFVPSTFPDNSWTYSFIKKGSVFAGGTGFEIALFHDSGSNYIVSIVFRNSASTQVSTTAFAMVAGNEYHIAVVKEANVVKIYVRGILLVTSSAINSNRFGGGGGSDIIIGHGLQGYLDRTRITNRALTPDEFTSGDSLCPYVEGGQVRKMIDTITGLDHLEGEEVMVQMDGDVPKENAFTVTSGEIELPEKAAVVHAGLPYDNQIRLLKKSGGSVIGTGQSKMKRLFSTKLRLYRTGGLKIGIDEDHLDSIFPETQEGLFTGDQKKFPDTQWKKNPELIITQDVPNPAHILAVLLKIETEEKV